jgi:Inner membrane component domain
VIGNIVWLLLAGWWLALGHLVTAILLAVTIVGIPFAWAHLKLAGLALWPIGKAIVPGFRSQHGVMTAASVAPSVGQRPRHGYWTGRFVQKSRWVVPQLSPRPDCQSVSRMRYAIDI